MTAPSKTQRSIRVHLVAIGATAIFLVCGIGVIGSTINPFATGIASGFAGYNLFWFVVLSVITRGARFFIEAELLRIYGEPIREFVEKRLTFVTTGCLAAIVGGFLIAKYAF